MCSQQNLGLESELAPAVIDQSQGLKRNIEDLIRIFNQVFQISENTRLVMGDAEPIYLPANEQCDFHQVVFAHGFFSSALHEVAHWCVAGLERRQLIDYGYWYAPDGRTVEQQKAFELVEVVPQALEWIFTNACGARFVISVDNLNGQETDTNPFKHAVYQQVIEYCENGLVGRAEIYRQQLAAFYRTPKVLSVELFHLSNLSL